MRSRLTLLLIALTAAGPAAADDSPVPTVPATDVGPSANDWLRVGLERYERGNLVGAIDAFERGHAREPRPVFLFAMAQAHRKRGDCARARALFDAFLATAPTDAQAIAAREQREKCEQAPPPPPVAAPAPPPPPPPAAAPPPPPRVRPWYSDRIALTAGAGGVIFLGASGALWLSSENAADAAATADTYDRHRTLRERSESRRLYAGIALGAGLAATGITIWRIARDRSEPEPAPTAGVAISPAVSRDSIGVTVGGSF
jgi:hypothetical protein